MHAELITDIEQLTAARLTDALYSGGHLQRGKVTAVRVARTAEQLISDQWFLEVAYSADAVPPLPTRLLLKLTKPGRQVRGKEPAFYQHVVAQRAALPVPRCFAATYCAESKREQVLLEDLSATHSGGPRWPAMPTPEQMEWLVAALAQLHAGWWEDAWLLAERGDTLEPEAVRTLFSEDDGWLARMLHSLRDSLPAKQAALFRRVYERFPSVYGQRLHARRALTLCHGDAHAWNFLYPTEGGGPVYLIDWQCWLLSTGALDMAYLIGLRWDQEPRRRHERDLVRRYHDRLLAGGVRDYAWDECWQDYRLMCLYNCYFPACFYHKKFGEAGMWRMIEQSVATAEDLNCLELLE